MAQMEKQPSNPPIEYAVAAWLGLPKAELTRGLAEGWIRRPPGVGESLPASEPTTGGAEPRPVETGQPPNASTLQRWLTRLDASVDEARFAQLWSSAGPDDSARVDALAHFVAGALGLPHAASASRIEAALAPLDGRGRIVDLAGHSGADLEALAGDESGVRRALATHSRWAITGDRRLAALADAEGRFDRFDRDSGEALVSQAWLGDRARHASWRLADADVARTTQGDGWRFIDRAAGTEADVVIASAAGGPTHQVIFARESGDALSGSSTTDRIHGGAGDDVLRGRGGDDLLQGNGGDDALFGGAGRDDLAGGRGDDELDGGAGDDRLDGGGGADELTGGRGRDLLRGGGGDDTYQFESGDGRDTVDDDDGHILIDGVEARGSMQREGSTWRSADGEFTFSLESGEVGRVLRIQSGDGGDAVEVQGWQQGRFGITLTGLDADGVNGTAGNPGGEAGHDPFGNEGSTGLAFPGVVDWNAYSAALDAWTPPARTDAGAALPTDAGVTAVDLASALAEAGEVDDGDAGAVDAWLAQVPRLPDHVGGFAVPQPPEVLLRPAR